jgi:hypothetical protein
VSVVFHLGCMAPPPPPLTIWTCVIILRRLECPVGFTLSWQFLEMCELTQFFLQSYILCACLISIDLAHEKHRHIECFIGVMG